MFGKKKADVAADDEYDYTKDQNYDETKKVSEQGHKINLGFCGNRRNPKRGLHFFPNMLS